MNVLASAFMLIFHWMPCVLMRWRCGILQLQWSQQRTARPSMVDGWHPVDRLRLRDTYTDGNPANCQSRRPESSRRRRWLAMTPPISTQSLHGIADVGVEARHDHSSYRNGFARKSKPAVVPQWECEHRSRGSVRHSAPFQRTAAAAGSRSVGQPGEASIYRRHQGRTPVLWRSKGRRFFFAVNYYNAIVPQVAAAFVSAWLAEREATSSAA